MITQQAANNNQLNDNELSKNHNNKHNPYTSNNSQKSFNCNKFIDQRYIDAVYNTVNWAIENRFGIVNIISHLLLPSKNFSVGQYNSVMSDVFQDKNTNINKIKIFYEDIQLNAAIVYPNNLTSKNNNNNNYDECTIFHNPNGALMAFYLAHSSQHNNNKLNLSGIPELLQTTMQQPMIMYDYRGTGMNKNETSPCPTVKTIVKDGEAVVDYALKNFNKVNIVGVSLGGGVATQSLANIIKRHDVSNKKIKVLIIDSFSTTSQVMLPSIPMIADNLGWLLGGNLDSNTAAEEILNNNIKLVAFNHKLDCVIPQQAQINKFIATKENARAIYSNKDTGHAGIDEDVTATIKYFNNIC